jgi:hypothetical protein
MVAEILFREFVSGENVEGIRVDYHIAGND